jgi:hypothetical protein
MIPKFTPAPANTIGWTQHATVQSCKASGTLVDALREAGIRVETARLARFVSSHVKMVAQLIGYADPCSGEPVIVLATYRKTSADDRRARYFVFPGIKWAGALRDERPWLIRYGAIRELLELEAQKGR